MKTEPSELSPEPIETETSSDSEEAGDAEVPVADRVLPAETVPDPVAPAPSPEIESWTPFAQPEFCPEPRYPSKARRRKQEGVVVLLLTVAADGQVLDVQVTESSGYSVLDKAALKALATWRFRRAPGSWIGTSTQVRRRIVFRIPK
ncbi:MAG: energy transducer TonB [Planctomycetes bacterium]|nr:energy transducer TonB [Planctomycetota bacterium]